MWKFKTDHWGRHASAVRRRLTKYKVDLTSHESRSEFGYCYLMYVK